MEFVACFDASDDADAVDALEGVWDFMRGRKSEIRRCQKLLSKGWMCARGKRGKKEWIDIKYQSFEFGMGS